MTSTHRRAIALCAVALLAVNSRPLTAQTPSQPSVRVRTDSTFPDVRAMAANMAPMMQQMMTAQLTATLEFYAKPETADLMARIAHNYYLALIQQGFTADQALAIVAAAKPGAPPSSR